MQQGLLDYQIQPCPGWDLRGSRPHLTAFPGRSKFYGPEGLAGSWVSTCPRTLWQLLREDRPHPHISSDFPDPSEPLAQLIKQTFPPLSRALAQFGYERPLLRWILPGIAPTVDQPHFWGLLQVILWTSFHFLWTTCHFVWTSCRLLRTLCRFFGRCRFFFGLLQIISSQ